MALASRISRSALVAVCITGGAAVLAQTPALVQAPPKNVLSLSAEASQEVAQDLLSITLSTTKEGGDASGVQSQLRQALDAALTQARKVAQPKLLEVRTGAFSIAPRYATKPGGSGNTITGWQGRAELVIEGSDTVAISQLAGRLGSLTVARVAFSLSREARERVEAEVAAQAITRFKGRADSYARQFGFGGYSLREVAVGGADLGTPAPNYRVRALSAAMAEEAQPVEAGKSLVTVQVNGSIELTPR